MSQRSLGVFVKAGPHPGHCSQAPVPIQFVALALPGGWTSGLARALLSTGGSSAVSTLQQPLGSYLEASKCWLGGLQGDCQALPVLGTAHLSPFPCTVVDRQRCKGRRKPLLMRALTQRMLRLPLLLLETIPPLASTCFSIRITESWTNTSKETTSGWCLHTGVWL